MRLIDADKIQEHLEKVKKESATLVDISHIIGFQSVVDAQPTAFDVEQVVSELEDYKMWKELLIYDLNFRERQILKKAIDIVKAGGIDE